MNTKFSAVGHARIGLASDNKPVQVDSILGVFKPVAAFDSQKFVLLDLSEMERVVASLR